MDITSETVQGCKSHYLTFNKPSVALSPDVLGKAGKSGEVVC